MKNIVFLILIGFSFANAQVKVISNGNLGIGTSSPQSKLDVNGNIQISNSTLPMGLMTEVGGTTPLLNMSLNFREPNRNLSYIGASFRIDSRVGVAPLFQWLGRESTTTNLLMSLTMNGNLGIGVSNPQSKLEVNGNIGLVGYGNLSSARGPQNNFTNLFLGGGIRYNLNGYYTVLGDGGSNYWAAIKMDNSGGNTGDIRFFCQPSVSGSTYEISENTLNLGEIARFHNGSLGLGTQNPSGRLHVIGDEFVNGYVYAYSFFNWSDKKLKNNILTASNSLQKVLQLRGVTYEAIDSLEREVLDYKNLSQTSSDSISAPKYQKKKIKVAFGANAQHKSQIGLIAQEVEKILPNLVATDSTGLKSVNYISIIPLLIEAIKEQNTKIETLEALVKKSGSSKTNARTEEATTKTENATSAYLYQNAPNPTTGETTIKYFIPETEGQSFITITDLNGKQIKLINIVTKGESSVTVRAKELEAGLYIYTLVSNGSIVDSKRMVILN